MEREQDDYDDGYVLHPHSVKPLQGHHHHPLDQELVFYEAEHIYTVSGVPTETSVTPLAHQFEVEFDPQRAIDGMKTSRSQAWPRLEYVHAASQTTPWTPSLGLLATCDGKTIASLPPHTMTSTFEDARALLMESARRHRYAGDVVEATCTHG